MSEGGLPLEKAYSLFEQYWVHMVKNFLNTL
jgi:hypothetical protein